MKCLVLTILPILGTEAAVLDIFRRAGAFAAGSQAGGEAAAHQSQIAAGAASAASAAAAAWGSYSFAPGAHPTAWPSHSFSWGLSSVAPVPPPAASPAAPPAASEAAPQAPAAASAAPAASPAAASPAAVPAAVTSIPTNAPAAVSSVISSLISVGAAGGAPAMPTSVPPAVSSMIASAIGSSLVSGLPASAHIPVGADSIPAAQCSAGGAPGGQWAPFLVAHQETNPSLQCPTDDTANIHWFLDAQSMGCCPQSAYLSTAVAGQYACCPCGSSCAGLPPAMFENWSLTAGTLIVGTMPYTGPAAQPTGAAASAGILPPGASGVFTTSIGGGQIVLPFQPNGQQKVFCFAEGCETILFGSNTAMTIIDPDGGGKHLSTTATRVLFATLGGQVIPTSTAYGVFEAGAGPKPTAAAAGIVMAGMVAGVAMVL